MWRNDLNVFLFLWHYVNKVLIISLASQATSTYLWLASEHCWPHFSWRHGNWNGVTTWSLILVKPPNSLQQWTWGRNISMSNIPVHKFLNQSSETPSPTSIRYLSIRHFHAQLMSIRHSLIRRRFLFGALMGLGVMELTHWRLATWYNLYKLYFMTQIISSFIEISFRPVPLGLTGSQSALSSGSGLMPSGNKPLPAARMTHVHDTISMG